MATGGGGGAGGTFGSPSSGNLPGTSQNNDPLALTGLTSGQYASGATQGSGFVNLDPLPGDLINVGRGALGLLGAGAEGRRSLRSRGYITYDQAQNLPASWYANDPKTYKQFLTKGIMYKIPRLSSDSGLPEVGAAWDDLLQTAIRLNKAQGKNVTKTWTPWDVLESYNRPAGSLGTYRSGDWLIDAATQEKVKYVGPKTKTTSQTGVDLSNADQVQAVATDALTRLIGRAPTPKELARFKATLNGYEKSHPEVTTTTDTYDDMGNVSASNVAHSGGVDDAARASLIGQGVQKTKEYGKYQAGVTYFNALQQMIGGG